MNYRERIGAELLRLRRESGLTQKTVSDRAGIDPSFLSLLENGKRDVTLGRLSAIVKVRFARRRA